MSTVAASAVPARALANGVEMPVLGYGVFQTPPEETVRCVREALEGGYRMIDTAQSYANEEGVGAGLRDSGLAREDVFLTTKIAPVNLTQERAAASIDESLRLLGTDYIDLMLLHQAMGDYPGAYRAMEDAYKAGKLRAIGVSNFYPERLIDVALLAEVPPAVNQIESHPRFPNTGLIAYNAERGIATEAWSPLGRDSNLLAEAVIVDVAAAHAITAAQAVLAWHVARGVTPIPKSASPHRQAENLASQAVLLSPAEVGAITSLGRPDGRLAGQDPETYEEM